MASPEYNKVIKKLNPKLWLKFNEGKISNTANNFGSLGSGWNATFPLTEFNQGQIGQLGFNEAIKITNVNSEYINKDPATPDMVLENFTFAMLLYFPTTATEFSGTMDLFKNPDYFRIYVSDNDLYESRLRVQMRKGNDISYKGAAQTHRHDEFFWYFVKYNARTGKIRINFTKEGVLQFPTYYGLDEEPILGEQTYSSFYFQTEYLNSMIDEIIVFPTELKVSQMEKIVKTSIG